MKFFEVFVEVFLFFPGTKAHGKKYKRTTKILLQTISRNLWHSPSVSSFVVRSVIICKVGAQLWGMASAFLRVRLFHAMQGFNVWKLFESEESENISKDSSKEHPG